MVAAAWAQLGHT